MFRIVATVVAVGLLLACANPLTAAPLGFEPNDDGQFRVRAFNITDGGGLDGNLDSETETGNIWNFLDANPGFTGMTPNLGPPAGNPHNVANNHSVLSGGFTTPNVIDFAGGGGNFGTNNPYSDIAGGAGLGGDDFSVRAQAFLQFTAGGTYTIAGASDDGRTVSLKGTFDVDGESFTGAPGYGGFSAAGGQQTGFVAGNTTMGFDGNTGHNNSTGVFTVNAGDILELDAFFHERGGGDSFEISIAQGPITGFNTTDFQLLEDGVLGIQVSSDLNEVIPEPASVAIWSVIGLAIAGFAFCRRRIRK